MCAIFGLPGGGEWVLIALVALLVFGKRLPEVARSLGKGIVEFKKGLRGMEEEIEQAGQEPPSDQASDAQAQRPTLPAGNDRQQDGPAG